jgi:hypothetical protein
VTLSWNAYTSSYSLTKVIDKIPSTLAPTQNEWLMIYCIIAGNGEEILLRLFQLGISSSLNSEAAIIKSAALFRNFSALSSL